MLNKKKIEAVVTEALSESDKFLVAVEVKPANIVNVFVDGDNGITIGECAALSRVIESKFDRANEDYELRVSSPGLDRPFGQLRQYKKYINRPVRIELSDGTKLTGKLLEAGEKGIRLEETTAGKKNNKISSFTFKELKSVKPEISFK